MRFKVLKRTSSQDGGIGRNTVPLCTMKRTTNLKTKNNQNYQKIELYGSPKTNELKKKHSSRPVGGVEKDSQSREHSQQGSSWRNKTGKAMACRPGSPKFACT